MTANPSSPAQPSPTAQDWRTALAQGDLVLETIAPIMQHLLLGRSGGLFSEQTQAQIRGMVGHLARQLAGEDAAADDNEALQDRLLANEKLLRHCHSRAMEWQVAQDLKRRGVVDPVLAPLFKNLIVADHSELALLAMEALAQQAHFDRQMRRMELPVSELPDDIFTECITMAKLAGKANDALYSQVDTGENRAELLSRLYARLDGQALGDLSVEQAGLSLLATILAEKTAQARETIIESFNGRQSSRLALTLRATGYDQAAITALFQRIRPDIAPPQKLDQLSSAEASAILNGASS